MKYICKKKWQRRCKSLEKKKTVIGLIERPLIWFNTKKNKCEIPMIVF